MTMHGLEERRNYAMGREADKGGLIISGEESRVATPVSYANLSLVLQDRRSMHCDKQGGLVFLQFHYNLPPDRAWLVPNGVGPEFFHARAFSRGIATKLLFVGTWIDHKGIYYLAEALEKVLRVIPEARLTVAGCQEPEERFGSVFRR